MKRTILASAAAAAALATAVPAAWSAPTADRAWCDAKLQQIREHQARDEEQGRDDALERAYDRVRHLLAHHGCVNF